MTNVTEIRRRMIETNQPDADLAADDGPRWNTDELRRDFKVINFSAPFVVVRRRSNGVIGSLEFTHSPRVYFGWVPADDMVEVKEDLIQAATELAVSLRDSILAGESCFLCGEALDGGVPVVGVKVPDGVKRHVDCPLPLDVIDIR